MWDFLTQEDIDEMLGLSEPDAVEEADEALSGVAKEVNEDLKKNSFADIIKEEVMEALETKINNLKHKVEGVISDNRQINESIEAIIESQKPTKKQRIAISCGWGLNKTVPIVIENDLDCLNTIRLLVRLSEKARREGLLALESNIMHIRDEFIKKGLNLSVDGTDVGLITQILRTESNEYGKRKEMTIQLLAACGNLVLVFGVLCFLLCIIIYGAFESWFLIPLAAGVFVKYVVSDSICRFKKLKLSAKIRVKNVVISGIKSVCQGDNPRIVEQILIVYLSKKEREKYLKGVEDDLYIV
jgi:chemotaxis protein MotA